jgi:hypothetical protein
LYRGDTQYVCFSIRPEVSTGGIIFEADICLKHGVVVPSAMFRRMVSRRRSWAHKTFCFCGWRSNPGSVERAITKAHRLIDAVVEEIDYSVIGVATFRYWWQMQAVWPALRAHHVPHELYKLIGEFVYLHSLSHVCAAARLPFGVPR